MLPRATEKHDTMTQYFDTIQLYNVCHMTTNETRDTIFEYTRNDRKIHDVDIRRNICSKKRVSLISCHQFLSVKTHTGHKNMAHVIYAITRKLWEYVFLTKSRDDQKTG